MSAKPIVAATDGSEESLRAVDWAAREAVLRGAPLRIVSAAAQVHRLRGGHEMSGGGDDPVAATVRQYRDQALVTATERAAQTAPGLLIDADKLDGLPGEAVTEAGSGTRPSTRPARWWWSARRPSPPAGRWASASVTWRTAPP
jgi:nucleotide-binding universal stress UspA family protein